MFKFFFYFLYIKKNSKFKNKYCSILKYFIYKPCRKNCEETKNFFLFLSEKTSGPTEQNS